LNITFIFEENAYFLTIVSALPTARPVFLGFRVVVLLVVRFVVVGFGVVVVVVVVFGVVVVVVVVDVVVVDVVVVVVVVVVGVVVLVGIVVVFFFLLFLFLFLFAFLSAAFCALKASRSSLERPCAATARARPRITKSLILKFAISLLEILCLNLWTRCTLIECLKLRHLVWPRAPPDIF
jgi:hypothetical protein